MMPWITTPDLADQVRRRRTVVMKHLRQSRDEHRVDFRLCGLALAQCHVSLLTGKVSITGFPLGAKTDVPADPVGVREVAREGPPLSP